MIQVLVMLGALAWGPAFAGEGDAELPYNVHQNPLDNRHFGILFKNGYEVRPDGTVWSKTGSAPVGRSELTFLVDHLISTQRLKALLQLNLILSKSQGEKKLKPSEKEDIRSIVRENWGVFTISTRKDFRNYFSIEELETLNSVAPLFSAGTGVPELKAEVGAPPPAPAWPAMAAAPLMLPRGVAESIKKAPAAPVPAAPTPPPAAQAKPKEKTPAPPASEEAPFAFHPGYANRTPETSPAFLAKTAPPPSIAPPAAPPPTHVPLEWHQQKPTAPPPPEKTPAAAAPAAPVPAAPAPAPVPPPAEAGPTSGEFEKFLADSPYGRQQRVLLRLVEQKAPPFARRRALTTVLNRIPQIVIDSSRTGNTLRSGAEGDLIALSPGPVVFTRRRFLFGSGEAVFTDSPQAYAALRLPVPELAALRQNREEDKREASAWGMASVYPDGSRRGTFSPEQQAGSLLRELLLLEGRKSGLDASPYAAEVYAATAQMLMYDHLRKERDDEQFLDPELKTAYLQWRDDPEEFRDHLLHTLAGGRARGIDPKRAGPDLHAEFNRLAMVSCPKFSSEEPVRRLQEAQIFWEKNTAALEEAGAVTGRDASAARVRAEEEFKAAREARAVPPDFCPARLQRELAALPRIIEMAGEALTAERDAAAGRVVAQ